MASLQDIVKLTALLSAAYPNWNITEFTNDVYYADLNDLQTEELFLAAQHCRTDTSRDTRFAPSTGEIRKALADIKKIGAGFPTSFQAWQEVQRQIVDNGGDHGTPVWSNPIVEDAVKALGWRNLRMSEDGVADRARFIQCYEQLASRKETLTMMLPSVKAYIEQSTGKALEAGNAIKKLTEGMKK